MVRKSPRARVKGARLSDRFSELTRGTALGRIRHSVCWPQSRQATTARERRRRNALTVSKTIRAEDLHGLIRSLDIPSDEKDRLLAMTPASYIGKAVELARRV